MEYDVRKNREEQIEAIRVSDASSMTYIAELIEKSVMGVRLKDSDNDGHSVIVTSIEHWENIKLGVEKAIQLGWLKND